MILSGCAVQRNGFGSWLASSRYRLMAAWRSTTDRNTPRFRRRLVSVAKKVSTALSQEHEVGVKWKTKRGHKAAGIREAIEAQLYGWRRQPLRRSQPAASFAAVRIAGPIGCTCRR